jgi:outer membrane protein OmpA-like peptidoglycan-associated protein
MPNPQPTLPHARRRGPSRGLRATLRRWALALGLLAAPAAALAQPAPPAPALDAHAWRPALAAGDGLSVATARQDERGATLGVWLGYSRLALAFESRAEGPLRQQVVLGDLAVVDLGGAWRGARWTFEASLPVVAALRGGGPDLIERRAPLAPVFGDARLGARWLAWSGRGGGAGELDLALRGGWSLPTAGRGSWLEGGGLALDLGLLASWRAGALGADLELGLALRPLAELALPLRDPATGAPRLDASGAPLREVALASGSRLVTRARLLWRASPRLTLALEGDLRGDLDPAASAGQLRAEGAAVAALPLQRGAWQLFAALGGAATASWGSPQLRAVIGARLRPGRLPADADGDGLDDADDRCPAEAEDRDGFEDADGCPDLDDDGDGVPDSADRCRLEAEDRDGFEDADGCPDPDDDGDGVADGADRCPRQAEDRDGFEDADGCPDPDNDGDAIPDADDFCPEARETVNGWRDADGCPDQPPPPPARLDEDGRVRFARPLRFEPGGAVLDGPSRQALTALSGLIAARKDVRALEVAAFWDDGGAPAERLAATAARAEAVKALLVGASGLQAHQIVAVGMGDALPLAGNDTAEGRARNRRVEVRVLGLPGAAPPLQAPAPPGPTRRRTRR